MKRFRIFIQMITLLNIIMLPFVQAYADDETFLEAGDGRKTAHDDECVILLHGSYGRANSMQHIMKRLQNDGYNVQNIGYAATKYKIERLATAVEDGVVRCQLAKASIIHIVGYSLGAIITRYYLANAHVPNIGRIILISPPNKGFPFANMTKTLHKKYFLKKYGPAGLQLLTNFDSFVHKIPTISGKNIAIIAGNRHRSILDIVRSIFIQGVDDGRISVLSTKLAGVPNHLVVSSSHDNILYNRHVHEQVSYFLQYGAFTP